MSALDSDFVQDWRLPTTFLSDGIQHTLWRRSRSGGRRRTPREETWRRERELGSGSFGQVFLERSVSGPKKGRLRALKAIRKDVVLPAVDYGRELQAAAKFSHDRYVDWFVRSFGWFEDDSHVYLSMEYLQYGDLRNFLVRPLPEPEAREIASQLVDGLVAMHRNNFVHRDLKPANILVQNPGPHWWVKIADFGISKRAEEGSTVCKTRIGTEGFCAPEVMGVVFPSAENDKAPDKSYTAAVDLWALGEIVYRMLAHRPVFKSSYEMFRFAEGHESLEAQLQILSSQGIGEEGTCFVQKLLVAPPASRISAKEAAAHPWLQSSAPSSRSTSRASSPSLDESPSLVNTMSSPPGSGVDSNTDLQGEPSLQWSTVMMEAEATKAIVDEDSQGKQESVLRVSKLQPQSPEPVEKVLDDVATATRHLDTFETGDPPRPKEGMPVPRPPSPTEYGGSDSEHQTTSTVEIKPQYRIPPLGPDNRRYERRRERAISVEHPQKASSLLPVPMTHPHRASAPSVVVVKTGPRREQDAWRAPTTYWTADETTRQLYSSDSDAELSELVYKGRRRQQEPGPRYYADPVVDYMPARPPISSHNRLAAGSQQRPQYRSHRLRSSLERTWTADGPIPRPSNPPPPPEPISPRPLNDTRFFCSHPDCPRNATRGWEGYAEFEKCQKHIKKRHFGSALPITSMAESSRPLTSESKRSSVGEKSDQGTERPPFSGSGDDFDKPRTSERRQRKKGRQVRFEEEPELSSDSTRTQHRRGMVQSSAKTDIGSNSSNDVPKESQISRCDHKLCGRSMGPSFTRNEYLEHIKSKHGEKPPANWSLDLGTLFWHGDGMREFGKGSKRRCTNCLKRIPSACECRWPS